MGSQVDRYEALIICSNLTSGTICCVSALLSPVGTTTLYAELIVVGSGSLAFILLFFYAFLGNESWLVKLAALPNSIGNAIYLIPALSIIYLLGIVIANVSHLFFKSTEERLRLKSLEKVCYDKIRNDLYTSPDAKELGGEFEFRRSKVRICRGWFINCILIIVALAACLLRGRVGWEGACFGSSRSKLSCWARMCPGGQLQIPN
jgi:hypothetical protein